MITLLLFIHSKEAVALSFKLFAPILYTIEQVLI